ncbi:hypothetical protein [Streptomyces tanashiensis]|uniref:hypothetical protein n=1 Tax=Streptomyces tanashiensis TaxID=67367 RepID=UPI001E320370|nr:hypothetical protein [Streptomyces tanashiensis]
MTGTGDRHLLKPIRQVYRYLHHDIGDRIRDEVRTELHRPGPRLIIAHSLGSVIAYDMLTRPDTGPGPDGLTTLVTCGSPLGWLTVRRSLGCEDALTIPEGVDWVNLRAAGDVVAHSGLASVAPFIRDETVNNGIAEPHAVTRYLSQQILADLVAKVTGL